MRGARLIMVSSCQMLGSLSIPVLLGNFTDLSYVSALVSQKGFNVVSPRSAYGREQRNIVPSQQSGILTLPGLYNKPER
jgi:hypothetical protein